MKMYQVTLTLQLSDNEPEPYKWDWDGLLFSQDQSAKKTASNQLLKFDQIEICMNPAHAEYAIGKCKDERN